MLALVVVALDGRHDPGDGSVHARGSALARSGLEDDDAPDEQDEAIAPLPLPGLGYRGDDEEEGDAVVGGEGADSVEGGSIEEEWAEGDGWPAGAEGRAEAVELEQVAWGARHAAQQHWRIAVDDNDDGDGAGEVVRAPRVTRVAAVTELAEGTEATRFAEPGFDATACAGDLLCALATAVGSGVIPSLPVGLAADYEEARAAFRGGDFGRAAAAFVAVAAALPTGPTGATPGTGAADGIDRPDDRHGGPDATDAPPGVDDPRALVCAQAALAAELGSAPDATNASDEQQQLGPCASSLRELRGLADHADPVVVPPRFEAGPTTGSGR